MRHIVINECVYNKLYIFRVLKECECRTFPSLSVKSMNLRILWYNNYQSGMVE